MSGDRKRKTITAVILLTIVFVMILQGCEQKGPEVIGYSTYKYSDNSVAIKVKVRNNGPKLVKKNTASSTKFASPLLTDKDGNTYTDSGAITDDVTTIVCKRNEVMEQDLVIIPLPPEGRYKLEFYFFGIKMVIDDLNLTY